MRSHGYTFEDCGGYICSVCGLSVMTREQANGECPGPPPKAPTDNFHLGWMAKILREKVDEGDGRPIVARLLSEINTYLNYKGDRSRVPSKRDLRSY